MSENNAQLAQARQIVESTGEHLFLTGRAGTGKTTFLSELRQSLSKRFIVCAPTGVAAMNAGGVTLHSFFQLPFGPYLPDAPSAHAYRFSREKKKVLRSLDLLIIDEVSMVRGDLLDSVDAVLRRFRDAQRPFGGVQLLLIGDLHQLSPVVKPQEQALLQRFYPSPYFFESLALKQAGFFSLELTKVYRQTQPAFIQLLNAVRDEQWTPDVLSALNDRYQPDGASTSGHCITLTTHNHKADRINTAALNALPGRAVEYAAVIEGDYPTALQPMESTLTLKPGARVMFTRNDSADQSRYYNGRVARVLDANEERVRVVCEDDQSEIDVVPVVWQNMTYRMNEATQQVDEVVLGEFRQMPLRLAWAITIHKSQGLTFDEVMIDASEVFAQGQLYVALSRCRSLEGMVLTAPIRSPSVTSDASLQNFDQQRSRQPITSEQINRAQAHYQLTLLQHCFDFSALELRLNDWRRLLNSEAILSDLTPERLDEVLNGPVKACFTAAQRFQTQLPEYAAQGLMSEQPALQQRLKKAGHYFETSLSELYALVEQFSFESDNAARRKGMTRLIDTLREDCAIKRAVFQSLRQGFSVTSYLDAVAAAKLTFDKGRQRSGKKKTEALPEAVPFPLLFEQLKAWRLERSSALEVPAYTVLHQKALLQIVCHLPRNTEALAALAGIGPKTVENYGADILAAVSAFATEQGIDLANYRYDGPVSSAEPKNKRPRGGWQDSVRLCLSGLSPAAVAEQQGLAISTVEGHLARGIEWGDLAIEQLMPDTDRVERIRGVIRDGAHTALKPVKEQLGDSISYAEIRWVWASMADPSD